MDVKTMLANSMAIIEAVAPITNKMSVEAFGGVIAMLVEEWCSVNEECDPQEFFSQMAEIAGVVKSALGDYESMYE